MNNKSCVIVSRLDKDGKPMPGLTQGSSLLARGGENGRHEFTHTTPCYDSEAQAHTRKSRTYVRYFYPSGSSVIQKESETDWSQSRTIAKSLTHVSHSKNSHPPSPIE